MVAVIVFLLRSNWRHTVYNVLEGGVMPMVVFYAAYATLGIWAALWACIGWTCITLAYRYMNHSRVSGLIILAAATVFARLMVALLIDDPRWFFIQPLVSTVMIALVFYISVGLGRPLLERLVGDMIPPDVMALEWMRPLMRNVTMIWATATLINVAVSLWLWFLLPIPLYAAAHMCIAWAIEIPVIVGAIWRFSHLAKRYGLCIESIKQIPDLVVVPLDAQLYIAAP